MSGEEPKVTRVTVEIELADGSIRRFAAEQPEEVTVHGYREPLDYLTDSRDFLPALPPLHVDIRIIAGDQGINASGVPAQ